MSFKKQGRFHQYSILALLALQVHVSILPLWVMVACVALVFWRFFLEKGWLRPPSSIVQASLMSITTIATFYFLGLANNGVLVGLSLASLFLGIRLLWLDSYRSKMQLIMFVFGLALSRMLFPLGMWSVLGLLLILGLLTTVLIAEHSQQSFWMSLRLGLKDIALCFPLALVLFLLFPRLNTGFVSLPAISTSRTGFSTQMDPTNIAKLANSSAVAFWVKFKNGPPPPMEQRYFRGAVLDSTPDGLKWFRSNVKLNWIKQNGNIPSGAVLQEIDLKPRFGKILFGLDTPYHVSRVGQSFRHSFLQSEGQTFQLTSPLRRHLKYHIHSMEWGKSQPLNFAEKYLYMNQPKALKIHLESVIPASDYESFDGKTKASKVMEYFKKNGFRYTRNPGKTDSLKEFLLHKKRGFCAHYAGAFASIMRHLGVPSRVVLGFHGGQHNSVSRAMVVRDSDAHAWAEVWQNGRWYRYDPTQVVAQERLAMGGSRYHGLGDHVPIYDFLPEWALASYHRAILNLEGWSHRLQEFMAGFDRHSQQIFYDRLAGQMNNIFQGIFLVIGILLLFFLASKKAVLPRVFRVRATPNDLYGKFLGVVRKAGTEVYPWETPDQIRRKACEKWPHAKEDIDRFVYLYQQLRYKSDTDERASRAELKRILHRKVFPSVKVQN